MYQCLLLYNSLTSAQRALRVLQSNRIQAVLSKPPRDMAASSCSHSVNIYASDMGAAMMILRNKNLSPDRVLTDFGGFAGRGGF